MKSICVKSNNKYIIDYLLKEFSKLDLESIYLSSHTFKIYDNVIVHYTGDDIDRFQNYLCDIVTKCIIFFYEKNIIKNLIEYNYFYFSDIEKQKILEACTDLFNELESYNEKYNAIFSSLDSYFEEHHSLVLNGFVNFRLKNYREILDYTIDIAVSNFLIEREYHEFIDVLHLYVNSKQSGIDTVHLVYANKDSILLDNNKDLISIDTSLLNATYLSDISFSSNDYCLNTLLNILPNKLYIHLINGYEDEFITTLKLIFDSRVCICTDCDICHVYRLTNHVISKDNL
ncbi:MAG: putative sporulation protein YtxC [Clostridia bacterium]|nr:putative sporulation protein YtxC [Clostridia bacterium]